MDCLECKICNVPYDEDEHKPRHAPCGHELCSACIKALIRDSIFECPKCRQKNKVDVPDDLPISFGLIDVIRAFKTQNMSLIKESGATNDELCKVHHKPIRHRCLKCQVWLCDDCLDVHPAFSGCSTTSLSKAVSTMKEKHAKDMDQLLANFKEDADHLSTRIQECTDKRKDLVERTEKIMKEEVSLNSLLEQGNIHKKQLVESEGHLKATNSPYAMMDKIEVMTQRMQALRIWSVKSKGTKSVSSLDDVSKELKESKELYVEFVIKDKKKQSKLSLHEDKIYMHTCLTQGVADGGICMPITHLQNMSPCDPSLVFLELSMGGAVKGRLLLRLDKDMPNISKCMVKLATGQQGKSFKNTELNGTAEEAVRNTTTFPFSEMPVTPDQCKRPNIAKAGDVFGGFAIGYLSNLNIHIGPFAYPEASASKWYIVGTLVEGFDILKECHTEHKRGVVISDCGIVIEDTLIYFTQE